MDWKSEYYQAYVVIVRLLRKRSKETAYFSNEAEQKPYQQGRFFENF